MLRYITAILALIFMPFANAESYTETTPNYIATNSKVNENTLQRYMEVKEPSEAQVFLFILEEELERYKSELSDKDYALLMAERKNLQRNKGANLQNTARLAFRTMQTHFKKRAINKIDENDFATQVVPLLQEIDSMNTKFNQTRYKQIFAKLSDAGRAFLVNTAMPELATQSSDIKIQWQTLANSDPALFKQLQGGMLTRLQSFKSAEDIEVKYYERPVYLMGGSDDNDQMATKQFGYKLVNRKGEKQ
jgi:hypothetical protein